MPQFAQIATTYASQIFWLVIVFGLIYFVIGKGMLPKIDATVGARNDKIASDLAAAESARATADETEAAYRARMDEARAAALKAKQEAKTAATLEAEKRVKAVGRFAGTACNLEVSGDLRVASIDRRLDLGKHPKPDDDEDRAEKDRQPQ
jgi:hypothetical protein